MIDLTPLDVRNKRGDFKKMMRGYDPHEVDIFLELAAERLEVLVRENLQLRERTQTLQNQVDAQSGREQAVQDALVTAQELRADIQAQSQREADHVTREAEAESRRRIAEAEAECRKLIAEAEAEVRSRLRGIERQLDHAQDSMSNLERRRVRFLKEFRGLLEREIDVVDVEEGRAPYEERAIDLELGPRTPPKASEPVAVEDVEEVAEGATDAPAAAVVDSESPEDVPETEGEPVVQAMPMDAEADVHELAAHEASVREPFAEVVADETPDHTIDAPLPAVELDVSELRPDDQGIPHEEPVDLSSLHPDVVPESTDPVDGAVARPSAPPAAISDQPSSLELELMAGASNAVPDPVARERFPEVPDLETLLAEAGAAEIRPTGSEDIAPPPAPGVPPENLILFDPNDPDHRR